MTRHRRREGAWIEIERCVECEYHQYCTSHSEEKYDKYQRELTAAVGEASDQRLPVEINPGPDERCQQVGDDKTLFKTLVRSIHSKGWQLDRTIRYPRIGAFEVWLCFQRKREEVFSKLKTGRWPNPQWLAERILKVAERLNVWEESSPSICSAFAAPEAPRSFVASKRSEVASAPKFGFEVDGADLAAKPAETAPKEKEKTAKSVLEVSEAPKVSAKPIELDASGSDFRTWWSHAELQHDAEKASKNFRTLTSEAEVREDKERQTNPKSLWDEEFEDFEPDIPQSGKSTNVQIPIDVSSRDEADIEKSLVVNVGTNQTSQSKNVKTVELENHSDNRLTFQVETKSGEDEGNKQDRSDIKEKEERPSTQEWEDDFEDEVKATASKGACEDVEEKVVPHLESQTLSTQSSQVKLEQPKPDTETDVANATGKHAMSADKYEEAFEESPRALQGSRTETEIEDADIMEIPEVEEDYEAAFEDEELSKPQVSLASSRPEPAEASPSRLSDFQDIFDEPLLSNSFGNDETSDSGDFIPDVEDPMVEVEEEDSVPMFGDFDKDRLPTVNEIDEDEEGEANFEVQMDAKVPTFDVGEVESGEASFSTFEPQPNPARVRPTSARVRRGQE